MSGARTSPFSPRVALALVLGGALAFIALLWAIGSGMSDPAPQPSGAHAQGKGLVGFAALSDYLKARDYEVSQTRTRGPHQRGGLLVLTPLHETKSADLARVIGDHRPFGPTLLIMPKWQALPFPPTARAINPKIHPGFVLLNQAAAPQWKGFHDEVSVDLSALGGAAATRTWRGASLSAPLPVPATVLSGKARDLMPLVVAGNDMRMLAGYFIDGGTYPKLDDLALAPLPQPDEDQAAEDETAAQPDPPRFPLIVVFDPDLLNNYGMGNAANAQLADQLVRAALDGSDRHVVFDLTLAGYARSQSLLELAFTPPFLAATLCLLLAAAVALWRAYHRFGPPLLAARSIAFGKRALVANAAGLLRRAKRLHLLGGPYADAARERLVKALALPARLEPHAAEAAIDRALAVRAPGEASFSDAAAALRAARRPRDMLRAAQRLNSLERILLQ
ncbi:MAG: DUF4350 domain-containing protein [Pseudomonadota bacterium]|nr:DUF4350 domain-containing protein [Pseudomonadota bacterium]